MQEFWVSVSTLCRPLATWASTLCRPLAVILLVAFPLNQRHNQAVTLGRRGRGGIVDEYVEALRSGPLMLGRRGRSAVRDEKVEAESRRQRPGHDV